MIALVLELILRRCEPYDSNEDSIEIMSGGVQALPWTSFAQWKTAGSSDIDEKAQNIHNPPIETSTHIPVLNIKVDITSHCKVKIQGSCHQPRSTHHFLESNFSTENYT